MSYGKEGENETREGLEGRSFWVWLFGCVLVTNLMTTHFGFVFYSFQGLRARERKRERTKGGRVLSSRRAFPTLVSRFSQGERIRSIHATEQKQERETQPTTRGSNLC